MQAVCCAPSSPMDNILFAVALLLGVVYAFAQFRALVYWRGGWRLAALLPLAGVVFVLARLWIDTRRDPTAHNLWPFEVLIAVVLATVALGSLRAVQQFLRLRRRPG